MRIIDLQRRLREVGRIRIGEQVATTKRDGTPGSRPKKLEHFRLTSRDQLVIDAAADKWGGTAQPWDGAPDGAQWEVFTEANSLPVIVPPGDMSFSQAYEQWTAGGCRVRCDGRWDHLADKACHCDPENRACDIHTRLSVMLPDLPGVGVWRLDTQGYYAAVELGGIVDLVASHTERGVMLPARLRLEQRSVKRIEQGKVVTRNFAVPVLDVDVHPLELTGQAPAGQLPATSAPSLTPVPPPDALGAPTLAEQMAQVEAPTHRPARTNAAAPMPSTGLRPRTAAEAETDAPADAVPTAAVDELRSTLNELGVDARRAFLDEFGCGPADLPTTRIGDAQAFVAALAPFADDHGNEPPVLPPDGTGEEEADGPPPSGPTFGVKDVARYSNDVFRADYDAAPRGTKTKIVDRLRHAVVYAQTAGRATSLNDLDPRQLLAVHGRLRDIAEGRMTYEHDEDGVTFTIVGSDPVRVTWADLDQMEAA